MKYYYLYQCIMIVTKPGKEVGCTYEPECKLSERDVCMYVQICSILRFIMQHSFVCRYEYACNSDRPIPVFERTFLTLDIL